MPASWLGVEGVIKYWGLAGIYLKASIAYASTTEFRIQMRNDGLEANQLDGLPYVDGWKLSYASLLLAELGRLG